MTKAVTVEMSVTCPVCTCLVLLVFRVLKLRVDTPGCELCFGGSRVVGDTLQGLCCRDAAVLATPRAARPGCRSSWAPGPTFQREHAGPQEKTAKLPLNITSTLSSDSLERWVNIPFGGSFSFYFIASKVRVLFKRVFSKVPIWHPGASMPFDINIEASLHLST